MTNDDEDRDDEDNEWEHISQHPPDTDIDQHIQQIDGFRVERMGSDGLWLNVYSNDNEKDIHFDIYCTDGGLHIKRRDEHAYESEEF